MPVRLPKILFEIKFWYEVKLMFLFLAVVSLSSMLIKAVVKLNS